MNHNTNRAECYIFDQHGNIVGQGVVLYTNAKGNVMVELEDGSKTLMERNSVEWADDMVAPNIARDRIKEAA